MKVEKKNLCLPKVSGNMEKSFQGAWNSWADWEKNIQVAQKKSSMSPPIPGAYLHFS